MSLVDHAKKELERSGWMDPTDGYNYMIAQAALDIVELFGRQGHSGLSAPITIRLVERLLRFEPLSELTDDPDEWMQVEMGDEPCWQSRRWSEAFSNDGGKRYYCVGDPDRITRPTQPSSEEPRAWSGRLT